MPALLSNRYLLVNENISVKFSLLSKTKTYFYTNILRHRYHKETAFPPQILSPRLFSFNDWQENPLTTLHNRNNECKILPMLPKQMWLCSFFPIATTNEGCHSGAHHQCDPSGLDAYYFVKNTKDHDAHTASFFPANIMAQDCASLWHSENCYCRTETIVIALPALFYH